MDLTLKTMCLCIDALGYRVIAELPILGIFNKGEVKRHPKELEKAEHLGRMLPGLL